VSILSIVYFDGAESFLTSQQSVTYFPAFYGTQRFITVFITAR